MDKRIDYLRQVKQILDDNNIEFWLDQGTLFGAVKQQSFFSKKSDVDLGIWFSSLPKIKELFDEFKKIGLKVYYFKSKEYLKLFGEDTEIDVNIYFDDKFNIEKATRFLYVHEGTVVSRTLDFLIRFFHLNLPICANLIEKLLFPIYRKLCVVLPIEIPAFYFNKFSSIDFYGMIFRTPCNIEDYLEYRYGKNWREPNKGDYLYYRDDGAIGKC